MSPHDMPDVRTDDSRVLRRLALRRLNVSPVRPTTQAARRKSCAALAAYTSFYSSSNSSLDSLGSTLSTTSDYSESSPPTSPDSPAHPASLEEFSPVVSLDSASDASVMGVLSVVRAGQADHDQKFALQGHASPITISPFSYSCRSSFDSQAAAPPPASVRKRTSTRRPRKQPASQRMSLREPVFLEESQGATQYFQDPEARSKLKQCVASPRHFQEVLDYGFPAKPQSPIVSARVYPEFSNNHVQAFLNNDDYLDSSSAFASQESLSSEKSDFEDDSDDMSEDFLDFLSQVPDPTAKRQPSNTSGLRGLQKLHRKSLIEGPREPTMRLTLTRAQVRDDGGIARIHTTAMGSPFVHSIGTLAEQEHSDVKERKTSSATSSDSMLQSLFRKLMTRK